SLDSWYEEYQMLE
ncbi:hypothetical protein A2U01_0115805, partial [Trifolium medium]|nr:hypothetical protein [Trifolium medium]